ncbi:MAG: DUF5719 family protein [Actinomycetaceae bacterium]|nr:DUF5719 family protein [Actinomycetaceae bacterium]
MKKTVIKATIAWISTVIILACASGIWLSLPQGNLQDKPLDAQGKKPVQSALSVAATAQNTVALCPVLPSGEKSQTVVAALSQHREAPKGSYRTMGADTLALAPYGNGYVSAATLTDVQSGTLEVEPVKNSPSLGIGLSYSVVGEKKPSLQVGQCATPVSSAWFIGASTKIGSTSELVLTNPSTVAVTVQLSAFDHIGPISDTHGDMTIAPQTTQSVRLDARYPQTDGLAVHVQASGAGIIAALKTEESQGLTSLGADFISPAAPPMPQVTIPAVRLGNSDQKLRIVNPQAQPVTASVFVIDKAKKKVLPGADSISVSAQAVQDISLDYVEPGLYSLVIEADKPVTAAAKLVISPEIEKTAASDQRLLSTDKPSDDSKDRDITPSERDFTWSPAVEAQTSGVVIVPKDMPTTFVGATLTPTQIHFEAPGRSDNSAGNAHANDDAHSDSGKQGINDTPGQQNVINVKAQAPATLQPGIWIWASQTPVSLGGIAATADNKGIAYIPGFVSAREATTIDIRIVP